MEGGVGSSSSMSEGGKKENCSDMAFPIVIECGENSYSISKKGIDQSQQIALSRLEWVEFIKLCDPVTAYMRGEIQQSKKEEEISWSLATENSSGVETWTTVSTKIHLFYVERVPYCNIAIYEGSTPSDQGVTLDRSEWEQVRISTARSSSFNVHLAVKVYRALLKDAIVRALPERCEDCKRNRVDVMKHECHVDKDRLIHQVAKELADTAVPPFREHNSQYGSGLGNVLGGIMRMAVPFIAPVVKRLGKSLVRAGAGRLERVIDDLGGSAAEPATRRRRVVKRPIKRGRSTPTGSFRRRAKPRRTWDILT